MLVDSCGNPIHFEVTGGQVHDSKMALDLIKHMPKSNYAAADKAYGSEVIRQARLEKNITPCLLYTSPSPRDRTRSRMPSSA